MCVCFIHVSIEECKSSELSKLDLTKLNYPRS